MSVITLSPFDSKHQSLPELGEGAAVEITSKYFGSRELTITGCIERVMPFERGSYRDQLYGIRTERGYTVMFSAELKHRLVGYLWSVQS